MQKIKQSNFELMRIVSMLFIILYHVIYKGHTLQNSTGTIHFLLQLLICITIVHVNSFMLLTGYFQHNKKFKLKKFLQTFSVFYFYKIIIHLIFIILNKENFTIVDYFNLINPFYIHTHWYIACYLIVYLLSPFLNILIQNMNQTTHRKLIITLLICFSIAPLLSNQIVGTNDGLTVIQFIMMYIIGAYLSKYPITNNIHFKNYSKNKIQTIFLISTIIFMTLNFMTYIFGMTLSNMENSLFQYVGHLITANFEKNNFILVILQSIFYFLWFSTLNIKSKVINYIGSLTFGIYIIHEHQCSRQYLYHWLKFSDVEPITSNNILIKVLIASIIIFIICGIIEALRQLIFNITRHTKIYQKISNKFNNFINNY